MQQRWPGARRALVLALWAVMLPPADAAPPLPAAMPPSAAGLMPVAPDTDVSAVPGPVAIAADAPAPGTAAAAPSQDPSLSVAAERLLLPPGQQEAAVPLPAPFAAPVTAPRVEVVGVPLPLSAFPDVRVADATPAGNASAPEVTPPYAPPRGTRAYTPARSKAEIDAERILFPDLAGPPEGGDHYGPPRLLSPGTPRDSRQRPLVLAPALSTQEPIPGAGAGNCVRRDERGRFMGWVDRQQCVFSGRAMVTARWVDDLFGDWHDDEATMVARLRAHTVWTESEGLQTKFSVHAHLSLPNARRRFRLIVSDESDDSPTGQDFRRQFSQEDTRVSAALRWIALDRGGLVSNFDVGARGFAPMDIFARYRLGKTWSLSGDSIARLSQTLRYGSDTKERYTPVLDFERALDERSVLRLTNYYDYRHETARDGFQWTHGVSFSQALHNSRSYSYGFSVNGVTRPEWRGESYGPWFIYRRPCLRPWIYCEVEPHYTFYRDRDWDGLASLVMRVEMQFGWK